MFPTPERRGSVPTMTFRHPQILALAQCPPASAQPRSIVAFRFTFDLATPAGRAKSFKPTAQLYPKRAGECDAWGLSMFATREAAKRVFASVTKGHPNRIAQMGDRLATGALTQAHGLITPPSSSGHFTLFEFQASGVECAFSHVENLV